MAVIFGAPPPSPSPPQHRLRDGCPEEGEEDHYSTTNLCLLSPLDLKKTQLVIDLRQQQQQLQHRSNGLDQREKEKNDARVCVCVPYLGAKRLQRLLLLLLTTLSPLSAGHNGHNGGREIVAMVLRDFNLNRHIFFFLFHSFQQIYLFESLSSNRLAPSPVSTLT